MYEAFAESNKGDHLSDLLRRCHTLEGYVETSAALLYLSC